MPRKDIWIRVDDLDKWESIKDKPLFLHNALNVREAYIKLPAKQRKQVKEHIKKIPSAVEPIIINKPEDVDPILVPPIAKNIDRHSNGLCKIHGIPLDNRGRCLQLGCKYA